MNYLKAKLELAQCKCGEAEALTLAARVEVLMMDHHLAKVNKALLEVEKRAFEVCKETHKEKACTSTVEQNVVEARRRVSKAKEHPAVAKQ